MNPYDPNNLADPDHPDDVEDLPLEEVDMEASDRPLNNIYPPLRAELLAMGVILPEPEGDQSDSGVGSTGGGECLPMSGPLSVGWSGLLMICSGYARKWDLNSLCAGQCRVRSIGVEPEEYVEVQLPKSVFRAILPGGPPFATNTIPVPSRPSEARES